MNQDLTELICILDRSGSMESIRDDAIGGFNAFLNGQKKLPGNARMTLVLFDDEYDIILDGVPLREVTKLTSATFVPRGMTALLDAVGRTLDSVCIRIAQTPKDTQPVKIICCILTDGMENSSKEYTRQQVFDKITKLAECGWEFVFLAANQDAIQAGESIGIRGDNSIAFDATPTGIQNAYSRLNAEVHTRRTR